MELDYIVLGSRIRRMRKEKRLPQEELVEMADISAPFLGHIERGSRKLSVETLLALCRALEVGADCLLGINFHEPDLA